MLLEEMLSDEWEEGYASGREAGIIIGKMESIFSELGSVPDDIKESIEAEEDIKKLSKIHKMAAKADSMEEFVKNYNEIAWYSGYRKLIRQGITMPFKSSNLTESVKVVKFCRGIL